MLEKISKINIKGGYFLDGAALELFSKQQERISIIYGRNGSGKSSIAKALRELVKDGLNSYEKVDLLDYDGNKVNLSDVEKKNTFVFDEEYINQNIKIAGNGLKSIVMFGEQIGAEKEIVKTEEELKTIETKIQTQGKICADLSDIKNLQAPDFHKKKVLEILKSDNGWAVVDQKIKDHSTKSRVNDETIKLIGKSETIEKKEELLEKFKRGFKDYQKANSKTAKSLEKIPKIAMPIEHEDKLIQILAKKVEEPELTEREQKIMDAVQNKGQDRVEEAAKLFSDPKLDYCPYCYQPISMEYKNKLIAAIKKIFNKDVDTHKEEIQDHTKFHIDFDYSSLAYLDEKIVSDITSKINECNKLENNYEELFEKKEKSIFEPIITDKLGLKEKIEEANICIGELIKKQSEYNSNIEHIGDLIKSLNELNCKMAYLDIKESYINYVKQEIVKKEADEKNGNLLQNKDQIVLKLDKLKQDMKNISIAVNIINRSLEYIFFSKERMQLEVVGEEYRIKSRGKNVALKNISVGEKNIIALCYFISSIAENSNLGEEFKKESLVLIDDPISSFDFEIKVGIHSFLRKYMSKIINGNEKSRLIFQTHEIEATFDLEKSAREVVEKKNVITHELFNKQIKLFREPKKAHNEYSELLKDIYSFACKETGYEEKEYYIGNVMRKVLEAFGTFVYKTGIEKISYDEDIIKTIEDENLREYFSNLMYRLVLHGGSHLEERVQSLPGNNFYEFISLQEKVRTAKEIIVFLYLLNKEHVIRHLEKQENIGLNIPLWISEIS